MISDVRFWIVVMWVVGVAVGYAVRSMVQAWRDDRHAREFRSRHPEGWQPSAEYDVPDGVLSVRHEMTDAELDRLRTLWARATRR